MSKAWIDISRTPFSRYGAYVSVTETDHVLEVRNVRKRFGEDLAYTLHFGNRGERITGQTKAFPEKICFESERGNAQIYIRNDESIVVDTNGLDVEFCQVSADGYGHENGKNEFRMISVAQRIYTWFYIEQGCGELEDLSEEESEFSVRNRRQKLKISAQNGKCTVVLKMSLQEKNDIKVPVCTDQEIQEIRTEWQKFRKYKQDLKEESFDEMTWFNLWSSFARAEDVYHDDVMMMSKKFMSSVWSWDHCFNALIMADVGKKVAMEQFMAPFYLQSETGVLPDVWVPNCELVWGITKPPIHGWCFSKLMDRFEFDEETLKRVYTYLEKWTNWWLKYRDSDGDGFPEYPQGCDCGWDNATAFDEGYFMETPDLPAFLILQMNTMARIADVLETKEKGNWNQTGEYWRKQGEKMMKCLLAHSWNGERFIYLQSGTHKEIKNSLCLLELMPLVLGKELDQEIREKLIIRLKKYFLTEHGLASESPLSEKYETDGYWRGPIWAPSTYLIVDGLHRGGYEDLAKEIAGKFCNMAKNIAKGNYDALTGKGLRAPGYTWTGSVYMLFKGEYNV